MNPAIIQIIIALGTAVPTIITDLDNAYKAIGTDTNAEAKVKDILTALASVGEILAKAI